MIIKDKVIKRISTGQTLLSAKSGITLAKNCHSTLSHIGQRKLYCTLKMFVYWVGMQTDCKEIVSVCKTCAKRKSGLNFNLPAGTLSSDSKFKKVFMDIAGPLPTCRGYRWILAIVDSYSKFLVLVPLKDTDSRTVCDALFSNWISIFGPPVQLHSDRGRNFISNEMKNFCTMYGIKKTETSPYHPAGNGLCERMFRTVKDMLYCLKEESNIHWLDALDTIAMTLRGTVVEHLNANSEKHIKINDIIKRHLQLIETKKYSKNINQKVKVGDKIMIRRFPIKKGIYLPRYDGPFKVVETKSAGRMIRVADKYGRKYDRNIRDVKLFSGKDEEKRIRYECVSQKKEIDNETANFRESNTVRNEKGLKTARYPKRIVFPIKRFE